jgi:hypothetical protein
MAMSGSITADVKLAAVGLPAWRAITEEAVLARMESVMWLEPSVY